MYALNFKQLILLEVIKVGRCALKRQNQLRAVYLNCRVARECRDMSRAFVAGIKLHEIITYFAF